MLLSDQQISSLNAVSHDGKVVFFGTGPDGVIWYSVKRSGFEDSALKDPENPFGFEDWKRLPVDASTDDASVRAFEAKNLSDANGNALLRSVYGKGDDVVKTVQGPVQLISGLGHIYVLRQSAVTNKILVSRFVLDGMKNELVAKLDVRFRRSKKRLEAQPPSGSSAKALAQADGLDFRDIDGNPFFEPATELSFIPPTQNGWFSAALVPTNAGDRSRWHIFAYDPARQKVVLYSVASSEEGLFDIKDQTVGDKGPDGIVYRSIPGIIQRTIDLKDLTVVGRPAATQYDVQSERQTPQGVMLTRDAVRLMLVVPVKEAGATVTTAAAINYSVAPDGMLSQIDLTPDTIDTLRSNARDVILPLTELDDIKVFGQANPPPAGTIAGMRRGSQDRIELRSVEPVAGVSASDKVRVYGTRSYDGQYTVTSVNGDVFEIEAGFNGSEPGYWEVVPAKQTGLTFDNMVVGFEKTSAGKLRVRTASHDLKPGDQVQIIGIDNADGMYTVKVVATDKLGFTLDAPFKIAEAANLTVIKHRGLVFDGVDDLLETPALDLSFTAGPAGRFGRTISMWIKVESLANRPQLLAGGEDELLRLSMTADNRVAVETRLSDGTIRSVIDPSPITVSQWVHYSGSVDYNPAKGGDTRLYLCKNGVKVTPAAASATESVEGGDKVIARDTPPHLGEELLILDGADDHLKITPSFPGFAKGITVEAWVYLDSPAQASGLRGIFNAVAGASAPFSLAVDGADHKLQAGFLDTGAWSVAAAPSGLPLNRWVHVAASYDNAAVRLYVDGALAASADFNRALPGPATDVYIGRRHDGAAAENLWKGRIAEVRVWNEARTLDQLRGGMFQLLAGTEPTLAGYWPLGYRSLNDRSQRKAHASAVGTPAWAAAAFRFPAPAMGAALAFASEEESADLPDPKIAGNSFTFSFWAKRLASTGADQVILCQGTQAAGQAFSAGLRADGKVFFSFQGNDLTASTASADSAWHHYVLTFDAASRARVIYRDGVQVAADVATGQLASSGDLRVGRASWDAPASRFAGAVSELCLWDRALTASEARVEVFRDVSGTEAGLKGYWTMEGGQARDSGPRKAHGKLNGNPKAYGLRHFIAGAVEQGPARCFAGEMSDLRIWDRALSDVETRDTMNLTPTGQEAHLAAYYRLGAVVPGEPALVPDFTPQSAHAAVHGEPYGGARTLNRATGAGAMAVKYTNSALVAVRQLATYEESFELRIIGPSPNLDPNDVDGQGNRLFNFACWGKPSMKSEEVIELAPGNVKQIDFQSLGGGWYRAACRMIIPEGAAMLRVFDLKDVRGLWRTGATPPAGEWTAIEVRRHKLRLISDAVSRETYSDVVAPAKLSSLELGEADVREAESRVFKYRAEIRDLLKRLDVAQNSAVYTAEKNALAAQVGALQISYINAQTALVTEKDNLRNYRFTLKNRGSGAYIATRSNGWDWVVAIDYNPKEKDVFLFELRPVDGEWSRLHRVGASNAVCPPWPMPVPGWPMQNMPAGWWDNWQLWKAVMVAPGVYQLVNKACGFVLEIGGFSNWRGMPITWWPNAGHDYQRWEAPIKELTADGARALLNTQALVDTTRRAIEERQGRYLWLVAALASGETAATVQALLTTARANLATALNDFAARNSALLSALGNTGGALSMATIQCDDRNLRTDAALLDFLRPIGGLSIAATSEGNVQVDYVDTRGRLRSVCYDAAADSRNSTFEQWLPETVRACLDVVNTGSMMKPAKPIQLPATGWTLETWFQYPLATKPDGTAYPINAFASNEDGRSLPVCVWEGNKLGVLVDGVFRDSGVRLERELVAGWHHLAAVGRDAKTEFYLNGVLAGKAGSARRALCLNGTSDYVEMDSSGVTFSGGITVEAWVYLETPAQGSDWRGIVSEFYDNGGAVQFNLCLMDADHKLQAGFWDGTTWYTVKAPSGLPQNRWAHVAATYDGNYVRVYIDGALVATSTAFGRALPATGTKWRIGRRHDAGDPQHMFKGKIAEVRLWDRPLSDFEIKDGMYRDFEGKESGLVGYWNMETVQQNSVTKLKDKTSKEKHGTMQGQPRVEVMVSQSNTAITCLGNVPAGGSPVGRLGELALWSTLPSAAEVEIMSKMGSSGFEPGLIAYWPLSETGGSTAYDRTADNHLTLVAVDRVVCSAAIGSPINVRKPGVSSTGGGDLALAFDGNAGKVKIPGINLVNKSFTVELWAQRPRVSTEDFFITQGTATANCGLHVGFRGGNTFTFAFFSNDVDTPVYGDPGWHHWACVYDATAKTQKVYRDGVLVASRTGAATYQGTGDLYLGVRAHNSAWPAAKANMAELRIWDGARTDKQIADNMRVRLKGNEAGLMGYWPLSVVESNNTTKDLTAAARHGAVSGGVATTLSTETLITPPAPLPLVDEILTTDVVCADYPTVSVSPAGVKEGIMRRCVGFVQKGQARFLYDARIESLLLQWIGNAQFKPTLLGYIEGAPPVPSENLTLQEDYAGATSVQLVQSQNVDYSWQRTDNVHGGLSVDAFLGAAWGVSGGLGIETKISEGKAGAKLGYSFKQSTNRTSAVRAASTLTMTDALSLRGALEDKPAFPHLGRRYVPKNVGYALVISGLADVFITKLARSGRMVGYEVKPVEGVPLDINTITFMINPAYTLNGSLDGMVGSFPADKRFYEHVPAMRAQYGSLYPSSYYRLREAYDIAAEIERKDKERETYFMNYDATNVYGDLPEGETDTDTGGSAVDAGPGDGEDKGAASKAREQAKDQEQKKKEEAEKRKEAIKSQIAGIDGQTRASAAFADWQQRMENILVKAGKRNIVNRYVWDADGGLRSEAQSFASSVEHTIGGESEHEGNFGAAAEATIVAFRLELSLMGSAGGSKSSQKGLSTSKSMELSVDLSGVESRGVTRLDDTPCMPGEKVDRYRFMTFYLEPQTKHFEDFFRTVVDPEWLMSNDEEARALRQTQAGKANRCWRVMHRVTYVERPALMTVGRDVRALSSGGDPDKQMSDYFAGLESKQRVLSSRLDGLDEKLDTVLSKLP